MTQPRGTRKTSAGRLYEWRAPGSPLTAPREHYWSVTTIIGGGIPKPALIEWAKKFTAEYAVANYKTLAMMLNGLTVSKDDRGYLVSDVDAMQGAIDWLKGAAYRDRDRKGNIGTVVHEQAEAYMKRKPMPTPAADAAPYVESFRKFLADWRPRYEMAEASVYNRTLKYAGTLDAIAEVDGLEIGKPTRLMLDYKTTGSGVYPEAAMQLAMYRHAEFVGMPDGTEAPMPKVDGAAVVWIRPDGYDLIPVEAGPEIFKYGRYAIEIFRWAEEVSKTVIGQPLPAPKREEQTT